MKTLIYAVVISLYAVFATVMWARSGLKEDLKTTSSVLEEKERTLTAIQIMVPAVVEKQQEELIKTNTVLEEAQEKYEPLYRESKVSVPTVIHEPVPDSVRQAILEAIELANGADTLD